MFYVEIIQFFFRFVFVLLKISKLPYDTIDSIFLFIIIQETKS